MAMAGIIGASINGIAVGLILRDMLKSDEMKSYLQMSSAAAIVPYLVLIPIGAFIGHIYGLQIMFMLIGIILIGIVVPLYFIILFQYHRKQKV